MNIEIKFFVMLSVLTAIMGVGTVVPGYLKMRSLELDEAVKYSTDNSHNLNQEVNNNVQILINAEVNGMESYVAESKVALIGKFNNSTPDQRVSNVIFDQTGKVLTSNAGGLSDIEIAKLFSHIKVNNPGDVFAIANSSNWYGVFQNNNPWQWSIATLISEHEVYRESWSYLRFVLLISVGTLLLVLIAYLLLTKHVRKRFQNFVDFLEGYKSGNYTQTMEISGNDEIAVLQKHVNTMINNIKIEINNRTATEKSLKIAKDEAEKANRSKSEFLANMSHEIRNPLNAITGFSALLYKTELSSTQRSYLDNVSHASKNLTATVTDILDITKIERGVIEQHKEVFNLASELNTTFNLFQLEGIGKGLKMECRIDPDIPEFVYGDQNMFSQIVFNLVRNAIKFTSSGHITVSASLEQEMPTCHLVRFDFCDSGIGINKAEQNKIFEMFEQLHTDLDMASQGVGLGLAIVKGIVEILDGKIALYSSPGAGSTFTITLPMQRAPQSMQAHCKNRLEDHGLSDSTRVLIVEDELLNREYISEILNENNIDFFAAKNGLEAIEQLEQTSYNVILMDIRMPQMNGEQAISHIRNKFSPPISNIPIIVLTANAFKEDIQRYMELGATSYLAKPFESDALLDALSPIVSNSKH